MQLVKYEKNEVSMARARIREQRREEILAAFEACVIRHGLAECTLIDVADEVGLPRSLVRYFVGNRDEMVELMIARMLERKEAGLLAFRQSELGHSIEDVVDFLFDEIFGNPTSNDIAVELWYLAQRDERVRLQLTELYSKLVGVLVEELSTADGVVARKKDVEAVAFSLMSLGYGESDFGYLGVMAGTRKRIRSNAYALAATLTTGVER